MGEGQLRKTRLEEETPHERKTHSRMERDGVESEHEEGGQQTKRGGKKRERGKR